MMPDREFQQSEGLGDWRVLGGGAAAWFDGDGHKAGAALAREVYDVSGAGDTVIATLAVMLAAGADWAEAIRVANVAAGIVVGKLGTAVVSRDEIAGAL